MAMVIEDFEASRHVKYRRFENAGKEFLLSDYPYLDIVFHDHCNARCKFCVAHLIHKKEWASFEEQRPKIDFAIKEMGVREVLLLGGEPTINDELFRYVDYLNGLPLKKICMTTNGHRLARDRKYAERLFSCGVTHLNLSLMSLDPDRQRWLSGATTTLSIDDIKRFRDASFGRCGLRINNNCLKGNHDSVSEIVDFYEALHPFCDSIKFSPLLKTDSFSTVNEVTEFNRTHILSDSDYDTLWNASEEHLSLGGAVPILRNKATFGFVEYSMVLLPTPAIFNYNQHGKLREKVLKERKINNLKLLPTGDLSLSWNREERDWFIDTNARTGVLT